MFWVDGPEYETLAAVGPNCGIFNTSHILEMNFYLDTYGMDSISAGTGMECYEAGVIDKEKRVDLNFTSVTRMPRWSFSTRWQTELVSEL